MKNIFKDKATQKKFLENYWETEHYVFKQVLDVKADQIQMSDLEEMMNDNYFETRLITSASNTYKLCDPPETIDGLKSLNDPWTLIVHNLNLYNTFCYQLEQAVNFIPSWLFDDVMCTFSSDASTLGAHIDRYNVFILQISGKRIWDLDIHPESDEYRQDCDIRVLKEFKPTHQVELSPGDMIYIPPGVAHRGESIGESLSLSIGFQSLEHKDIFQDYMTKKLSKIDKSYSTSTKELSSEHHIANKILIDNLYHEFKTSVEDKSLFEQNVLSYLSLNKLESPIVNDEMSFSEFQTKISAQGFQFFEDLKIVCNESYELIYINGKNYHSDKETVLCLLDDSQNKLIETHFCKSDKYAKLLFELYQDNLLALE
jgi:50S ribosomal protein L16 3-hydroxylase